MMISVPGPNMHRRIDPVSRWQERYLAEQGHMQGGRHVCVFQVKFKFELST